MAIEISEIFSGNFVCEKKDVISVFGTGCAFIIMMSGMTVHTFLPTAGAQVFMSFPTSRLVGRTV
jgi:hypothetical protein